MIENKLHFTSSHFSQVLFAKRYEIEMSTNSVCNLEFFFQYIELQHSLHGFLRL